MLPFDAVQDNDFADRGKTLTAHNHASQTKRSNPAPA
tara:strand:- start:2304 stop:2414 length:111 start_codon:yes stop_codon:yes gene_type:complete